jgi:DNA-directed RNA polymerase specialized sigma24 family protein
MPRTGTLTREGFERLLGLLDADPARAGERYELLRRKLVRFFEWHHGGSAEDQADLVLDRVGRRLAEGEVIRADDPSGYFFGVARNVLHEHWERQKRERRALVSLHADAGQPVRSEPSAPETEEDRAHGCLQLCLERLTPERRRLIVEYYQGEKSRKIRGRQVIAESLRIAPSALRLRAFRIRGQLERCVRECLARRERNGIESLPIHAVKRGER